MAVEQNLAGVETLKQIAVLFGYGFMLFDPSSSFDSVREKHRLPAADCRRRLGRSRLQPHVAVWGYLDPRSIRVGRASEGDLTRPDYAFLDPRLNDYHRLLSNTVRPWIHGEGLSYQLNYAWDELETVRRLVFGVDGVEPYRRALQSLTKESNEQLFKLVEDSSKAFEAGDRSILDVGAVQSYCEVNVARLIALRNRFIADNIYLLRDASQLDAAATGPSSHRRFTRAGLDQVNASFCEIASLRSQ